jgi:hypothetical protein
LISDEAAHAGSEKKVSAVPKSTLNTGLWQGFRAKRSKDLFMRFPWAGKPGRTAALLILHESKSTG